MPNSLRREVKMFPEGMTNQSLRERFKLSQKKAESVSRAIRDTIEAGMIKLAEQKQMIKFAESGFSC